MDATTLVTPDWLYQQLGRDYCAPAAIRGIACKNIGEGQGFAGIVLRVRIDYDRATDAPTSLIVKLPSPDPEVRALLTKRDMLFKEPRFYRDIVPGLNVRTPRARHVFMDETAGDYALILEDLGDIANAPDKFHSIDDVVSLLRAIAPFHAQFWNHPLALEPWMYPVLDNAVDRQADLQRISRGVQAIEQYFGESYLLDCAREIDRQFVKAPTKIPIMKPFTLIHGDYHFNNVANIGGEICIYDWQIVSRGTPDLDVTNLMLTSLSTDDFVAGQERCYGEYHRALVEAGVSGYKYKKFRKNCDQSMMMNIIKYVAILGTIDMNVPGGNELRNRVLVTLNTIAERTEALKFFKRLPVIFLILRVMALFSRK